MNGFVKKSIGTLTLGEKMRKLREERRVSLREMSKSTRIQIKYLESLENGSYHDLPADVYVKGFLRNYADFLGVNENIFIKLYNKEIEISRNLEQNKNPKINYKNPKREAIRVSSFIFTPKIIAVFLSVAVTVGIIGYLFKEVGEFSSQVRLVILNPTDNLVTDESSVVIEGVTDRDAMIYINNKPVIVDDNGKFREMITLQSGPNTINVRAVNKFNKESDASIVVQSNKKESEFIATDAAVPASNVNIDQAANVSKKVSVDISVDKGPTWVSVEADGEQIFSGNILVGSVQNFQADKKIMIDSANAKATLVKLNGKDMGNLGANAKPIKGIIYTAEM